MRGFGDAIASQIYRFYTFTYTIIIDGNFIFRKQRGNKTELFPLREKFKVSSISMEMIFCPPGTFIMGSPTIEKGHHEDESQHQVTLTNGFYLSKYEVTQGQYETVMKGNVLGLNAKPSHWSKRIQCPVENVSWNDVQVFLRRLNNMEKTADRLPAGWKYTLPTEAEWEYACRAGTNTSYSYGENIANLANYNYDGDLGSKQTCSVGQYASNPWGFFDMHGNVW